MHIKYIYFQANPRGSTRRHNTGLTRSTLQRILKDDLALYPYKIQSKNKLKPADLVRRLAFCQWLVHPRRIHNITFVIGDEAQFLVNGKVCTQNVRHYAPRGNPPVNFTYETDSNNRQSVRVWAGVVDQHLLGPFFFNGNLDSQGYINLIQQQVIPALQQLGYRQARHGVHFNAMYFIQDGAPCHTSRQTRAFLEQYFPGKVVSRFNATEWPPRSPDLNPCDFWLWGYLKAKVYTLPMPASVQELQARIRHECQQIPGNVVQSVVRAMYDRANVCVQRRGRVVEGRD